MNTTEIIIKVIPIIVSIALGYFLTRAGFLKLGMVDAFKKIVVNVTLPAGLFIAFIKIRFKIEYAIIILCVFVMCILLFYIAKIIARVFAIKSKYFPFLITGFEAGMIGYALFTAVFGADAATDFAVVDIGQVIFVFLLFVPMLINLESEKKGLGNIKTSLKTAVKSPVIWAIVFGIIGALSRLWVYEDTQMFVALENIFLFVSAPTAFLICLVIGSGIKLSIKAMKMEMLTAGLKVAVCLLFAFVLVQTVLIPLGVNNQIITAMYALCCLPGPFVIPVFIKESNTQEISYISNTLSFGSVIGVICYIAIVLMGL